MNMTWWLWLIAIWLAVNALVLLLPRRREQEPHDELDR